ncbi:hypothetical protein [Streptomyces sp. NPDC054961]
MATLFCQFLPGYLGRTAEHRGRDVEDEPLWSMLEIQKFSTSGLSPNLPTAGALISALNCDDSQAICP